MLFNQPHNTFHLTVVFGVSIPQSLSTVQSVCELFLFMTSVYTIVSVKSTFVFIRKKKPYTITVMSGI